MYTSYWNLKESPFLNVDNLQNIYPSSQLKEGVARLYYLIDQERIAGMLTGSYGVGKSFLLTCLSDRAQKSGIPLIRVDAIPRGEYPLVKHILGILNIRESTENMADALMLLQRRCMDRAHTPQRHVLIIDEAQYLSEGDGLYLTHYLSNLRIHTSSGDKPLFTIILAGTPVLAEKVMAYESLRLRIQLAWQLEPLSPEQTLEYVQQHVRAAGGDLWIFSREALAEIHKFSGGVPRNINNLCDTALMLGFAGKLNMIDENIVRQAAENVGFKEPVPEPAPQPVPQPIPQPVPQPIPQPVPQPMPQYIPLPQGQVYQQGAPLPPIQQPQSGRLPGADAFGPISF